MEEELRESTEKLEDTKEKLSDRDLEISILQKRLELRRSSKSSASLNKIDPVESCHDCKMKDALIATLAEKVQLYESILTFAKQDLSLDKGK